MKRNSSPVAAVPPVRLVTSQEPPPPALPPRQPRHLHAWLIGIVTGGAVAGVGTWLDYGLKARLPAAPAVLVTALDDRPVVGVVRTSGSVTPGETRLGAQPIAGAIAAGRGRGVGPRGPPAD